MSIFDRLRNLNNAANNNSDPNTPDAPAAEQIIVLTGNNSSQVTVNLADYQGQSLAQIAEAYSDELGIDEAAATVWKSLGNVVSSDAIPAPGGIYRLNVASEGKG